VRRAWVLILLLQLSMYGIECISARDGTVGAASTDPVVLITKWIDNGDRLFEDGNYSGAIEFYDRAINIDPTNASAYYKKGNALKENRNYAEAVNAFDSAIKFRDNYKEAWYGKGLSLEKNDETIKSIEAYEEAIKIDQSYDDAVKSEINVIGVLLEDSYCGKLKENYDTLSKLTLDKSDKKSLENIGSKINTSCIKEDTTHPPPQRAHNAK
jgi:tetratricopeptide (TPR) repeat protein